MAVYFIQARRDGRLDHVERAELARRLPGLIARLEAFRAGLGAA